MRSPQTSLTLILYYVTSVSALSPPFPLAPMSTNTTFSGSLLSHTLPNLTAPLPPPGFSTRLAFNSSIQLNAIKVYVYAIELMSLLANIPWLFTVPGPITVAGEDPSTLVLLRPWPPGDDSALRVEYAVLGLYQVGLAIAQGSKFYELEASIYIGLLKVGLLEFRPHRDVLQGSSKVHALSIGHTNETSINADSGIVRDPNDKKFALTYEWDGVRIKAQDVFTVILDGFAVAAKHKNTDLYAFIPAARSASGDTVLSTWTVGDAKNPHMTWARLKRALIIIWNSLIIGTEGQKTRFEGFLFGLQYDGKAIGGGRMLRFDADSKSDVGVVFKK